MKFIIFEIKNAIATIRLNRPDKYNSFVREMALEMQDALDICAKDKELRVVFITGEGKAFSAGQDLIEATEDNGVDLLKILKEHLNPIINKIKMLELPVVCGVNGVAAGAGVNIALACDITIAKESASFIQAFTKIGLIPDSGGTYTLPRLVGMQKAMAYMLLGDRIYAPEAEKAGMIYKYIADDEYEEFVDKLLKKLANMPTKALALTKKALQVSMNNTLQEQLMAEEKYQQIASLTYDYSEGTSAFLEKRKAQFKGE